ncbi:MAG: hypothetical protein RL219_1731 [Actinomycetota bacterium]
MASGDDFADELPRGSASRSAVGGAKRRSGAQRLVLGINVALAAICLIAALAILVVQRNLEQVKRVDVRSTPSAATGPTKLVVESLTNGEVKSSVAELNPTNTLAPVATVAPGSLKSVNFLMTGSDNRSCIDPNSPFAGTFLGGGAGGNRPDTIMLLHVEPDTGSVGLLSFPRDLWVPVAGTNRMSKINATFNKDDPARLIATIESFFQIPIDHYVSIDFCVFKDLVNAVGGIRIPFKTPLRDRYTRLNVPEAGCFKFNGDHALAYVRSRHLQYKNDSGTWKSEGTSDIGRIKRQQDFIRRVMNAVRSKGVLNIGLVTKLVNSFQDRVVVDADLTPRDVLQLAGALKNFDPSNTRSFIVEGQITNKASQSVVDPRLSSARMRTILGIFRGQIPLSKAPDAEGQTQVYGNKSIVPESTGKC